MNNSVFIPRAFRKVTREDVIDAFEHLFNNRFRGNIRMAPRKDRKTGEKFWIITVTINHDGNHMGIIRFFNDLSSEKPIPVYLANGHYLKCCMYNPPRSRVPPPSPPTSPPPSALISPLQSPPPAPMKRNVDNRPAWMTQAEEPVTPPPSPKIVEEE